MNTRPEDQVQIRKLIYKLTKIAYAIAEYATEEEHPDFGEVSLIAVDLINELDDCLDRIEELIPNLTDGEGCHPGHAITMFWKIPGQPDETGEDAILEG